MTVQGINREWWDNKTVAGTAAVLGVAFLSLDIPVYSTRLVVACLCALGEAFGGRTLDNAVIALPALGSYVLVHGWQR